MRKRLFLEFDYEKVKEWQKTILLGLPTAMAVLMGQGIAIKNIWLFIAFGILLIIYILTAIFYMTIPNRYRPQGGFLPKIPRYSLKN